jgi:hypothetical protein
MVTATEIRKLAQPLLERNPDLAIIGRFVFFKQVGPLLRGIHIYRCGDKRAFVPNWRVDYLFRPINNNDLGLGEEIYPAPEDQWYIDIPNIDKKFADRIEEAAVPRLNGIKTIEEFSNITYYFCGQLVALNRISLRKLYVDLALGKFQQAEEALEFFSKQPDYRTKYFHSPEHYDEMMNEVRPMIQANDKLAIATKLHELEAYSVKQLKLEKYWQPSPFPIEM